jgi:histone acetyltransferase (RNA polymerase elongator complex component)
MSKSYYIIPIFVPHEGCPHDCVFCNQNSITGFTTKVDAEFVKKTVEEYLTTIPNGERILEISFFGGTFTAINIEKQKELLAVAKRYKDLGVINYIRLSTRPDYINDEILSNLKMYSVDIIELGVQSMDLEVLRKSARGHSAEDVVKASGLIKKYGFVLGHQIMLGLPGDNKIKDIETAKQVIKLEPDMCRIYPAVVIKDTPMEVMYRRGIYNPYSLEEAIEVAKIIYCMLVDKGINVIRVGLQPTDEIKVGGDIVAGPFHPAFRELVEGSIFSDLVSKELAEINSNNVDILINGKDISKLYCGRKIFFNDILGQFKTVRIKVIQDSSIQRGNLVFRFNDICKNTSIDEFISSACKEGNFNIL